MAVWIGLIGTPAVYPAEPPRLAGRRPNIILIMSDDQGKGDLSCLGNPDLKTPNLDRLYQMSTRFTNFQFSPTCSPTRSAIMSGRHEFKTAYPHHLGTGRDGPGRGHPGRGASLGRVSYRDFRQMAPRRRRTLPPHNRGFEEVFIHGATGVGQAYNCSCADAPPNQQNRYFDPVIRHNGRFVKTQGFCTDVFFRQALGRIKKQKDSDRPFFVYLTPNAPHAPPIAPEKYKKPFLEAGFDETVADRYGMIVNIDDNIGLLLQKLDEWQLWERTLVIFMTDNGQAGPRKTRRHGRPYQLYHAWFRSGKGTPYEGGTCVPCFWRWKGVLPEGQDIAALAAHVDLFPTFVELAGAKLPPNIQKLDGRSLVPLLENPKTPWPARSLFTHVGRWPKGANPDDYKYRGCAVRNQRFRLVNNQEL